MSTLFLSIQTLLTTFNLNNIFIVSGLLGYCLSTPLSSLISLKILLTILISTPKPLVFGLQNSLAVIHPLVILLTYVVCIKSFSIIKYVPSRHIIFHVLILVFITLTLGGIWAFQEFNWGGWWNWDGIETPIFIAALILVYIYFHSHSFKYKTQLYYTYILKYLFWLFIVIIMLPRFGNTNSIHSFISLTTNYLFYNSHVLVGTPMYLIIQLVINFVEIWTFFWVKIFLLTIFIVSLTSNNGVFKNKHKLYIFHKLIYIFSCWAFFMNFKSLTLLYNTTNYLGDLTTTTHTVFAQHLFKFWLKPPTVALPDTFSALVYFLN